MERSQCLRVRAQKRASCAIRWLVDCEVVWIRNLLIGLFQFIYKPNMNEAEKSSASGYGSFNDFFARRLKPESRSLAATPWICPVDGFLVQSGKVRESRLLAVKGSDYSVAKLLDLPPEDEWGKQLRDGVFAIFYLSPRDYHRVHSPCAITVRNSIFIPGSLSPVKEAETRPRLYARNQRVAFCGDGEQDAVALVMVGALFVSSIVTAWGECFRADHSCTERNWQERPIAKGDEMGHFRMGSSVVLLSGKPNLRIIPEAGSPVKMGAPLFIRTDC